MTSIITTITNNGLYSDPSYLGEHYMYAFYIKYLFAIKKMLYAQSKLGHIVALVKTGSLYIWLQDPVDN